VRRSAEICAGSLASNPRVLDYCLAFSLYADALEPGRDHADARLAMARQALPPQSDPQARLAEVGALTRTLTGSAPAAAAGAAPGSSRTAAAHESAPNQSASRQSASRQS